jgi:hypothetical protein
MRILSDLLCATRVRRRSHCVILLHRNGVTEELNVDLRGFETTHVCTDDNGPYRNRCDVLKPALAPFDCCIATVTPARWRCRFENVHPVIQFADRSRISTL